MSAKTVKSRARHARKNINKSLRLIAEILEFIRDAEHISNVDAERLDVAYDLAEQITEASLSGNFDLVVRLMNCLRNAKEKLQFRSASEMAELYFREIKNGEGYIVRMVGAVGDLLSTNDSKKIKNFLEDVHDTETELKGKKNLSQSDLEKLQRLSNKVVAVSLLSIPEFVNYFKFWL